MEKIEHLDELTADKHGFIPNPALVSLPLQHSGNGHGYVILGYTWDAERHEWMVRFRNNKVPVDFVRTAHNFFGNREVRRFERVLPTVDPATAEEARVAAVEDALTDAIAENNQATVDNQKQVEAVAEALKGKQPPIPEGVKPKKTEG